MSLQVRSLVPEAVQFLPVSFGCFFLWVTSRPGGTRGTEHPTGGRRTLLSLWGSSSQWISVTAAWERTEMLEPAHPWLPAFPSSPRKRPPSQTRAGQSTGEQEEGLALKRRELRACRAGLGAAHLWASEPCLRNGARRPSSFLSGGHLLSCPETALPAVPAHEPPGQAEV